MLIWVDVETGQMVQKKGHAQRSKKAFFSAKFGVRATESRMFRSWDGSYDGHTAEHANFTGSTGARCRNALAWPFPSLPPSPSKVLRSSSRFNWQTQLMIQHQQTLRKPGHTQLHKCVSLKRNKGGSNCRELSCEHNCKLINCVLGHAEPWPALTHMVICVESHWIHVRIRRLGNRTLFSQFMWAEGPGSTISLLRRYKCGSEEK